LNMRELIPDIRWMLFWTLLPLVLPQAIILRRNAPRLSGATGPTAGSFGSGKSINLLAIGDSIIAGVGAATIAEALPGQVAAELSRLLDCEVYWRAAGFIGATSSALMHRLVPPLPSESSDVIVLSVGVNDVTSLRTMRQWSTDLGCLLDDLRTHSPEALITLVGLPPLSSFPLLPQPLRAVMGIRARMFDDLARIEVSKRDNVVHVPLEIDPGPEKFSSDGFHPSPSSYRELGRQVASSIVWRLNRDSHIFSSSDTVRQIP